MPDVHIYFDGLPSRLQFVHTTAFIKPAAAAEANSIEAKLTDLGIRYDLQRPKWTVVCLYQADWQGLEELSALIEFALAILAKDGHSLPRFAALMNGVNCDRVRIFGTDAGSVSAPTFPSRLNSEATSAWIRGCLGARARIPDRMHITTSRFARFARTPALEERIVDLCISLESLLDAQTEIAFRFATCLTLASGLKGTSADRSIELLGLLYDVRSKIVHADPSASKRLGKLRPHISELRELAVRILTNYVLFLRDGTRKDWESYLRRGFFRES